MYLILIYYCYLFLPIFTFLSVLVNQDFGYRAILVTLLWAVPLAYAGLVYPYIYVSKTKALNLISVAEKLYPNPGIRIQCTNISEMELRILKSLS